MEEFKVYTLAEIAGMLKITRRTLYTYVKAGILPATKFGKSWRVSEADLKAFMEKGAQAPTADGKKKEGKKEGKKETCMKEEAE